jgi:general secretion pathway protein C
MMEWILNRRFWIVHLALISLFTLALASILSRAVGKRLDVNPYRVERPARQPAKPQEEQKKLLSHYAVILDKNIFKAVVKEAPGQKAPTLEKPVPVDEMKNLAKTSLDVRLRGTAVRDKGESFAVIEDKRARKEDLYRVGDMILGEAKLVQILDDRVVILRDGNQEILDLFVEEETKGQRKTVATSRTSPTVPATSVQRLGSNRWSISRDAMAAAKANTSELMTQVRIAPNFNEGKPDGFKLLSIKRGSLFDQLGLRNGDVVRQINGVPLDSPEKALEIYGQLESNQSISVNILRRGREQTFTYELK